MRQAAKDANKKPAWGQGGANNQYQTEKISKYKANLIVKARVDTGLNASLRKTQNTQSSRSLAIEPINEEKEDEHGRTNVHEINLQDLLDPQMHPGIEYVQILNQKGNMNIMPRSQLIALYR